jgi:putative ABC transport system permease protein
MWSFRKKKQSDLDDEIAHDLALDAAQRVREGASPEQASRESRRDFGNVTLAKEDTRAAWGFLWVEVLLQDLRYAARTLRRSPGFAATAIATLALGIGVNTAIFTIFDQIAFRPLPIPDGDRLVGINESFHGRFSRSMYGNIHMLSYPELQYYAAHNHVFTSIAAYTSVRGLSLAATPPESLSGLLVTGDYFRVLGGRPALGRILSLEECATPHAVVVLSHPFWQRRFGGDPAILGTTIRLNQALFTVVGVMSPEFRGGDSKVPDLWLPISMQPEAMPGIAAPLAPQENQSWLTAIAKLKPGITVRQAQADLAVLASQLDKNFPGRIMEVSVTPGGLFGNPEARAAIMIAGTVILLIVGLVLLVACANIANLLLARAAARQREIAVRLSMGASRARLIRQLLTESAVIAVAGGGLGLLLARWSLKIGYTLLASRMPLLPMDLTLDRNVLLYTLLISAASSVMFGLLPALQATSPDLCVALKDEGALLGCRVSKMRMRGALIAGEMAVCMVLLLGAGLMVHTVLQVQALSDDLHLNSYMVVDLNLRLARYDSARAAVFHQRLKEQLDSLPGVTSALTLAAPYTDVAITEAQVEGQNLRLNFAVVSPTYFDVMGIHTTRGRTFTAAEVEHADAVVVISEALARHFWPGQDPIGRQFAYRAQGSGVPPAQVIGVVKDARSIHVWEDDGPMFYKPMSPKDIVYISLISRLPAPGSLPTSTIREMVRSIDPAVMTNTKTLADNVEREVAPVRVGAALAAILGALALLLALAGIYCVVTYSVSRRTREIGIRMTLGAERSSVIRLMLTDNMRPVLIGMAVGLVIGIAAASLLSKVLLGVRPLDPVALLVVAAFLSSVALLASYIPARRATRVDPAVALRYE